MPPRLYHRKSKTGCQLCRQRRVKCDEARPACGKCKAHGQECIYDRNGDTVANKFSPQSAASPMPASNPSSPLAQPASETRQRRLLELQLLHYFCFEVCSSLPGTYHEEILRIWNTVVPRLAIGYDILLNAIMTLALRHMLCTGFEEVAPVERLHVLHAQYLEATLQEYSGVVCTLTPAIADPASFTSIILSLDGFASLRDRDLSPYTAPVQWLRLCRGVEQVFGLSQKLLADQPDAYINKIVWMSGPFVVASKLLCAANRNRFPALLVRRLGESDEDDEAHVKIASYVGAIQNAKDAGEHIDLITRQLMIFPVLFPRRFVELLGEHRPRALVILAHFFAVGVECRRSPWVGDTPRKEILALGEFLAPEYQAEVAWPLRVARQPTDKHANPPR